VQSARLLPGEYLAERARAALRDDQPVTAAYLANRGIAVDEQNADLHFYLGLSRVANAERFEDLPEAAASFYREATIAFERARSLAPRETIYALELAMTLDAQQRYAEAEAVYYDALQLDPRSSSIRRYYEGHLQLWSGLQTADPAPDTPAQPPADPAPSPAGS
jgi:tetratricopeptide (TPR) repeat protein